MVSLLTVKNDLKFIVSIANRMLNILTHDFEFYYFLSVY